MAPSSRGFLPRFSVSLHLLETPTSLSQLLWPGQTMTVQCGDSQIHRGGKSLNQPQQWRGNGFMRASLPCSSTSPLPQVLVVQLSHGTPQCRCVGWTSLWDETLGCAPCVLPRDGHHPVLSAASLLEAETLPALGTREEVTLLLPVTSSKELLLPLC